MTVSTIPSDVDVLAIAEEVWSSFVSPDEPLVPVELDDFPVGWSGAVRVTGAWSGVVVVEMLDTVAWSLTERMFGEATEADMPDAVGELANMLGGNVKALTDSDSDLALPIVAEGRICAPSASDEIVRVELASSTGPLRVTVHQLHVQAH